MPGSQRQRFRLSTQTARIVKLNVAFILLFCMHVSARGWSQVVHFTGNNVSLTKIFAIVKEQTGYVVMYNPDVISAAAPVSINATNMPLPEFLDKVLTDRALSYSLEDKTIFIKKRPSPNLPAVQEMMHTVAQELPTVSGFVRDEKGGLVPGVSIKIKGSAFGTTSNESGYFKLNNVSPEATLLVTSVGYETLSIPLMQCCQKVLVKGVSTTINDDNSLLLNLTLTLAVKSLQEIAVTNTGFQTISAERSTGAFSQVDNKTLSAQINPDMASALEGKAAGLSLYQGNPIIRGVATFSQQIGTQPLLVIDGLISESTLDMINPYDVESVTVLKDGAAASIYGARAANGVIVINTKQGKRGQTTVTANVDRFITQKPNLDKMHYATSSQLIDYQMDVYNANMTRAGSAANFFANYGGANNGSITYFSPLYNLYRKLDNGSINQQQFDTGVDQLRGNDYFQQFHDLAWQQETRQRYNLAVASGTEKSNTFFSLDYDGTDKLTRKNTSENMSAYLKSSYHPRSWFNATFGVNVYYTKDVSADAKYADYLSQERYEPIVDAQGNKVYQEYANFNDGFSSYGGINGTVAEQLAADPHFRSVKFNILDALQQGKTTTQNLHLRGFTDINAQLLAGLKYTLKFQYETDRGEQSTYDPADDYKMNFLYNGFLAINGSTYTDAIPTGGRLYQMNNQTSSYSFRHQLDYDHIFNIAGRRHDLVALGGFEMRQNKTPLSVADLRYGFDPITLTSRAMDWYELANNGADSYIYGTNYLGYQPGNIKTFTQHRYVAYYGNASYTYDYRYNLTASARVDEADLFGADPKYRHRPLWSVGLGWNATNEQFLKNVPWLDYLKVRATYGVNGNVDRSSSPFTLAKLKNDKLFPALQWSDVTLPNPKLRWEKTATTNLGFDFTLFKNLLRGSLDFYSRQSTDLLVNTNLDPTVGSATQVINNGAMSNKGIELGIQSDWFKTRNITLSTAVVVAYNDNKIKKVNYGTPDAYSYVSAPGNYFFSNTPFNSLWAYGYAGMQNGYPTFYDANGKVNVTFDGNGVPTNITQINDIKAIRRVGTTIPKYNGSIRQSVRYKNFELGAFFAFYAGHQLRKDVMDFSGKGQINTAIADRYTDQHHTANPRMEIDYPEAQKSYAMYLSQYYRYADNNIASAASVRLRSLTLSYSLLEKQTGFLKAHTIKLMAQANNLWLWAPVGNDIDPETFSLNSGSRNLPTPKSFLFSATLGF